ncbi:hypothetical protein DERP_006538 [Dermatophagoides pteronyssinus]|uniref:Uncharacterized protein n=1 Tax=Dermatophagoides pteronyssinus TaxID=6956 RepID=A0ABQ8IQI4_DERPT|nr:hypothetical protein DERP_006538 [Dermatophagoides pteronyssinus]
MNNQIHLLANMANELIRHIILATKNLNSGRNKNYNWTSDKFDSIKKKFTAIEMKKNQENQD